MKSKEDILNCVYFTISSPMFRKGKEFDAVPKEYALQAMDQYSEQIAIGFYDWVQLNSEWIYNSDKTGDRTTLDLYNLYKQTLK